MEGAWKAEEQGDPAKAWEAWGPPPFSSPSVFKGDLSFFFFFYKPSPQKKEKLY